MSPLQPPSASFRRRTVALLAGLACVAWPTAPWAQPRTGPAPAAPHTRWESSIADFAKVDQAQRPAPGGVLFVGSSSIRLWQRLPDDFRQAPVVLNRGFGGSTMADLHYYARQLVVQYRPRQVLVYAGENDLAEGRSPQEVLESFRAFVEVVRTELPGVRLSYISVKPSPLRAHLLDKVRETNELLARHVNGMTDASYIDVFTPMIDGDGRPRAELFGPDRLHMNRAGYELWRTVISSHVASADVAQPGVTPAESSAPAR